MGQGLQQEMFPEVGQDEEAVCGGGWAGSDENQMLERFRVGPYLKIHPFPPKETEGPGEVDVRPLSLSATAHAQAERLGSQWEDGARCVWMR